MASYKDHGFPYYPTLYYPPLRSPLIRLPFPEVNVEAVSGPMKTVVLSKEAWTGPSLLPCNRDIWSLIVGI